MLPAKPIPRQFQLRSGDSLVTINGWETSYTLGIYHGATSFVSCLLMGGYSLIPGFDTLQQAHEFNKLVMAHPRLFTGTSDLNEFYERAGGKAAAWSELVKLRAKVLDSGK